jgi:uncharacterized protein YcbX
MQIFELWRFPIKGFGGSQINTTILETNGYFPCDRHFAISSGGQKIAAARSGAWFPKAHFLQLMSHEALAEYKCEYLTDGAKPVLELFHHGKSCISIDPDSNDGRRQFEDFIFKNFSSHLNGQPRLMQMKDQAYSDQSTALISIASNASLDAFADATGTVPGNRRFRINIIIDADKAFSETDMIGQTFHCGKALVAVQKPVGRCAAINVDPKTALRSDQNYVGLMRENFGHSNLGVFAKVIRGGEVKVGDVLRPI